MHICHVNLAGGFSGGERQTVNLIRELAGQSIRQTLIARPGSRLFSELDGAPNVVFRECSHFVLGHSTGGWDLIHCHDGKAVYWGWIESLVRRTPYIITRRVDNRIGSGRLTTSAYGRASAVVCLSSAIERVVRQRLATANTVIIPSSFSAFPAEPERVSGLRSQYSGKRLVGQVGRLLKHKGYQVTIEAARRLRDSSPDLQFVFLGEGPDEDWLQKLAEGLPNIRFLGHRDDVGDWLAALDVFVFPSLSEGLGSTILEAMQHRVPVIGANAGGIPDLIKDRENGLLVTAGDAQALAVAIQQVLDEPGLAEGLATEALEGLKNFSPEEIAGRYAELYRKVLTTRS
ncbi:glycosyltransferase family 4 protein [Marinobacter goseongensis]|uniref:glycosyltransferase family 4 protein n=1 Tax=Marinobacter goseongensis TaxID=453838 RepID=UPI0020039792|nr:glycosyltransferase family 4 protein [Marinobacter goseongensis]MCK7551995.1 glycosyltransferase family 4 protein [Marinobacter goseongensis]